MDWNYVITPAFIGRFAGNVLEIKRIDNDEWQRSEDQNVWDTITNDGTIVPEKTALSMHEKFKLKA